LVGAHRDMEGDEPGSPVVSDDEADSDLEKVDFEAVGDEIDGLIEEDDSSSDEEKNTIGDVPIRWYDGYDHIGYNREGKQIIRGKRKSPLEEILDPKAWRRVYDEKNDEELVLTDKELDVVARIRAGQYTGGTTDGDEEIVPWTSNKIEIHPLPEPTEPKRRFTPSKHEAAKVVKIVRAIRAGLIVKPAKAEKYGNLYSFDVWEEKEDDGEKSKSEQARDLMRIHAPKEPLPGHAESYNPPEEYLPTEQERKEWEEAEPGDRKTNFLPTKYDSLRKVPAYPTFIRERFERCLDLYTAVRVRKEKLRINPEDLIPKLPSPEELKPFPNYVSCSATCKSPVLSISMHPAGQFLAAACDDGFVRFFEVPVLKCIAEWQLHEEAIVNVDWCPKPNVLVFAACAGHSVIIGNACSKGLGTEANAIDSRTLLAGDGMLEKGSQGSDGDWTEEEDKRIEIKVKRRARNVSWHHTGDYLASVARDTTGSSVVIHRLSNRQSQVPFKKSGATAQVVAFHPSRPFIFIASKQHIRVFNLQKQVLVKKLLPGARWISSLSVHPSGDHLLVATYDMKLCWFDLDLSNMPYKILRNHDEAIREARFHPKLPLFADCSDDGTVFVSHGMVYNDLLQNALIVPLKRIDKKSAEVRQKKAEKVLQQTLVSK